MSVEVVIENTKTFPYFPENFMKEKQQEKTLENTWDTFEHLVENVTFVSSLTFKCLKGTLKKMSDTLHTDG